MEIGVFCDSDGKSRLVVPFPEWDELLGLSFDEIRSCGATRTQVMRRMNALVAELILALPEKRHPALQYWDAQLKASIARSFADSEERLQASKEDRQGFGAPRRHTSGD